MNTPSHTPGPWTIDPNGELPDRPFMVGRTLYCVADVGNEADAKLIAAAPELLEALKALHGVLDLRLSSGLAVNQVLPEEVFALFYGPAIAARAAIAKATNA